MRKGNLCGVVVLLAVLLSGTTIRAQGLYLPGGGAAHISMGGASTASPVDSIGALYWNPAAIGRLGRSEASIGGAFLYPNFQLESTVPGLNGPRSGRTRSDSGMGIASSLGVVLQQEDSPLTFGLGLSTLGGGAVNFPGDPANPILAGVGPLRNVLGPIAANTAFLQLNPTVAYKLTDKLILGAGPTISVALASFDPAYFAPPDDANGDGIGTFPTGSHSRPFWGGGFRAGLVYSVTERLDVGFGYTSPQWFETWKFNARNELGVPRSLSLNVSLPAIYSWGFGYRVTDRLQLAVDLRYFDYQHTDLFGQRLQDGGLGWQSVFVTALGARYQVTDRLAVSGGYVYNENPIPSTGTLFNIQGPTINQHTLSCGATLNISDSVSTSLGYAYGLPNSISGPVREATGFGVKLSSDVHMITFGLQIRFGGGCCNRNSVTPLCDSAPVPSAVAEPVVGSPQTAQ